MSRSARRAAIAALLTLAACGQKQAPLVTAPPGASRSVVLRDVRVFDAPHATLAAGANDVVVKDGRIAAIAPRGVPAPGIPDIDGHGGVLLPGLVDVHAHTGSTPAPPWTVGVLPDVADNLGAFLYAGVTTVLDLGNLTPAVFGERTRVATHDDLGPRLYAAGPVFTAVGGHPAEVLRAWLPWYLRWYVVSRATREIATPDDGRRAVEALLPEHPDILKLAIDTGARDDTPRLDVATIAAVTAAGHAGGVRSIAHIGSSAEVIDAVRGGVDALAHAPWREELSDEAVAVIAGEHTPVVVTLAVWDASARRLAGPADLLPIERQVARPDVLTALFAPPPPPTEEMSAYARVAAAAHDARRRNVTKLRAAGVPVLAGSDGCNYAQFPGAGLHLELAKLVDAGLTPAEALRAATWDNARFLAGDAADYGEIAVGKRADLILVAGDPTTNIADLANISQVVVDGTLLERHARPN